MRTRLLALPLSFSLLWALPLAAETAPGESSGAAPGADLGLPVRIGDRVRASFKDIRFVSRSLEDFREAKALVVIFSTLRCPVAGRYAPKLEALRRELEPRGVQFLSINSSPEDALVAVAADALERGLGYPVYKDFDQSAMRAFGVRRTPEVAVLDGERVLRYRGRVDDQFRVAGESPSAGREHLRVAVESVLAGKRPEVEETTVEGCVITTRRAPQVPGVSYSEHVAPILQRRCQECHRPGQTAPFSLLDYHDAASQADMIREVVEERRMPPYYNDPRHGEFINGRWLSDDEVASIVAWVDAGVPRGDPTKEPAPLQWPKSEWLIGEPDLVIPIAQKESIPAQGIVRYRYPELLHVFEEDTWISAIQILPGNRRVVHHANLYIISPPPFDKMPVFVTGHVPGGDVTRYPAGSGVLLPKGSHLSLQVHYITTGKDEEDLTRVGLVYAKETIQRPTRCMIMLDKTFEIPPFAPAHEVKTWGRLSEDAVALGLYSHMHLRGKDMTFIATYPDGASEVLLRIPNFSFDWQLSYQWREGQKRLPAGTRIDVISHFDNSALNPFNPDPGVAVHDGPQTFNEMSYGFFFFQNEKESLGIEVDPKTGRPIPAAGS